MPKRTPHIAPNAERKVIEALQNPRFKYRTVSGIARETHIDAERVGEILKVSPSVRVSLTRAQDGSRLFALKKSVSKAEDVWTAFKAVNGAKFGD